MPNFLKFYRVVVEKHAPFREDRDGQKIIHSQFFVQLRMRCIQLGSRSHGENPAKFRKIPVFLHLESLLCTILTNYSNLQQGVLL